MQQQLGNDRLCELCQNLGLKEQVPKRARQQRRRDYGTPSELKMRQECPICRLVLTMLPSRGRKTPSPMGTSAKERFSVSGDDLDLGLKVFYDDASCGTITSNPEANPSLEKFPLKFQVVKDWVEDCETGHTHDASTLTPRYQHPVEIILIDVLDQKLVRASSSCRFLTISYVWGETPLPITTTVNRSAREQPGALSKAQLPQLILDAMLFVSRFGERYLWVDFLCIEQDNVSQMSSQVSQMDVIYSQSLLTLVALSARDAQSCLPGVREGTRSFFRAKERAYDRDIYASYPDLFSISKTAKYESRGWTFQERLLSRRSLFFTQSDMYYICHSHLSCETRAGSDVVDKHVFKSKFVDIFTHLNAIRKANWGWTMVFRLYAQLVHDFSKRDLSYDTDVINAFSGISAVLGHYLNSQSVSGLIECVLDSCLLWVPRHNASYRRNINFPSWSWSGWVGGAFYLAKPPYTFNNKDKGFINSRIILTSLVEKFETQSISPLRSISQLSQHHEQSPLIRGNPQESTRGMELLVFEATTIDVTQLNISFERTEMNAEICLFSVERNDCVIPVFRLLDVHSQTCGYLHPFPETTTPSAPGLREVIALSLSHPLSPPDTPFTLFDHGIFEPRPWCLVNIMLIERKGNEAERVTIGQIHIDVWNKLETRQERIRLV